MTTLYENILARLQAEVPEILWIDYEYGQLDQDRPTVSWPCALITINIKGTESFTETYQRCDTEVEILLGWDIKGQTSANVPEATRASNLAPYDLIKKVWNKLQGWEADEASALDCTGQGKESHRGAPFSYALKFGTELEREVE